MPAASLRRWRPSAAVTLPTIVIAPPAWAIALIICLAALAIRSPSFGNPAIQVDEQFYLLVGDRMLQGQLPYIDIWDRKPIGLFLIYAAIRLLGGVGILQYQLVATAFAAATAWLVSRLAGRVAGVWPGIGAGICYLVWIGSVAGDGGQAPVFYNLPMLGAAALAMRAMTADNWRALHNAALAAMALVGLAMQIKYTVVVEGIFFGLVILWQAWRRFSPQAAVRLGLACIALTLLPTMLAFAYFAHLGAAQTFIFANFTSIALRGTTPNAGIRLAIDFQHVLPLGICCAASWWQTRAETDPAIRQWRLFVLGWLTAAAIGFACIGAYFYHYLLPVYLPLAIGAAPIFRRLPIGPVLAGLAIWIPLSSGDWPDDGERVLMRGTVGTLVALIPPEVDRGCLQMFDGPPVAYLLRHACLASRWPFPDHLVSPVEAHAIGVDPVKEIRRIMAARPLAIVVGPRSATPNTAMLALDEGLGRSYRLRGTAMFEGRTQSVYVRR